MAPNKHENLYMALNNFHTKQCLFTAHIVRPHNTSTTLKTRVSGSVSLTWFAERNPAGMSYLRRWRLQRARQQRRLQKGIMMMILADRAIFRAHTKDEENIVGNMPWILLIASWTPGIRTFHCCWRNRTNPFMLAAFYLLQVPKL